MLWLFWITYPQFKLTVKVQLKSKCIFILCNSGDAMWFEFFLLFNSQLVILIMCSWMWETNVLILSSAWKNCQATFPILFYSAAAKLCTLTTCAEVIVPDGVVVSEMWRITERPLKYIPYVLKHHFNWLLRDETYK